MKTHNKLRLFGLCSVLVACGHVPGHAGDGEEAARDQEPTWVQKGCASIELEKTPLCGYGSSGAGRRPSALKRQLVKSSAKNDLLSSFRHWYRMHCKHFFRGGEVCPLDLLEPTDPVGFSKPTPAHAHDQALINEWKRAKDLEDKAQVVSEWTSETGTLYLVVTVAPEHLARDCGVLKTEDFRTVCKGYNKLVATVPALDKTEFRSRVP